MKQKSVDAGRSFNAFPRLPEPESRGTTSEARNPTHAAVPEQGGDGALRKRYSPPDAVQRANASKKARRCPRMPGRPIAALRPASSGSDFAALNSSHLGESPLSSRAVE